MPFLSNTTMTFCFIISQIPTNITFQGDEITKDTFRVVDSGTEYTPHENKILKSTLYACVSEEPPEYLSDPGLLTINLKSRIITLTWYRNRESWRNSVKLR